MILQYTSAAFGVLWCMVASVAVAQESAKDFEFGKRPMDGVFDPSGILGQKQRNDVADPLGVILETQNIDVMVVILPEIGSAPPKHVAKGFRDEWAVSPVNAVVLHVPGNPQSPWIFPGDIIYRVVKASQLEEWIDAGEKRASSESDDFGKIRAASVEATDIMRYSSGGALLQSEILISERFKQQIAHDKKERLMKMAFFLSLAGAVPIVIGLGYLVANFGKSRPRNFPIVRKIPRLGAPYAGGNNAAGNPRIY